MFISTDTPRTLRLQLTVWVGGGVTMLKHYAENYWKYHILITYVTHKENGHSYRAMDLNLSKYCWRTLSWPGMSIRRRVFFCKQVRIFKFSSNKRLQFVMWTTKCKISHAAAVSHIELSTLQIQVVCSLSEMRRITSICIRQHVCIQAVFKFIRNGPECHSDSGTSCWRSTTLIKHSYTLSQRSRMALCGSSCRFTYSC